MSTPTLLRTTPVLLLTRLHRRRNIAVGLLTRRSYLTARNVATPCLNQSTVVFGAREPPKFPRWDDPEFKKWRDKEAEIFSDIEPIVFLTKEILHSDRYMDGEQLTEEDEKVVVEKLLAYHPHSEDKIGCGLDSIMVDKHPQFKHSRCLFVIRTDGGWIDFSYQKCLRSYIKHKYPAHAERFIREHFKRGG